MSSLAACGHFLRLILTGTGSRSIIDALKVNRIVNSAKYGKPTRTCFVSNGRFVGFGDIEETGGGADD